MGDEMDTDLTDEPTMADVMKALGKLQRENDALKVQMSEQANKKANTVDYYACNICGDHTEGERCPKHPTEPVNAIGITVNQAGETRQAILSKS
jgi:rubrerythrin